MNFSRWLKQTRRIRRRIHNMFLKVFTFANAVSLLFIMMAIDSLEGLLPIFIMALNFSWLCLMAYANGWMYDTEPYHERERKEGRSHDEM